jgi:hypothetical protein
MTESINAEDIKHRVEQGLLGTPYACSKLEKLSGGSVNYVYRGTLVTPLPDGAKTIVLKHTEGYIASSPDWKLSQARGVRKSRSHIFLSLLTRSRIGLMCH